MKILNKIESLVNKLDNKLFGKNEKNYKPYSGKFFIHILVTTLFAGILLAIVQVCTKGKSAEETVEVIAGIIFIAIIIRDTRIGIKSITGIGKKIGYVFFNILLTVLASQLAMYIIFLAIFLIVGWIILTIISPDKNSKEYQIHYSDGTTEKVKSEKGIAGEDMVKTRNGYINPNDPEFKE